MEEKTQMNHGRLIRLAVLLICVSGCSDSSAPGIRTMNYFPDGRDIVCYNGANRYTRALYGTGTTFRLETSDRPVFAVYDKKDSYNFTFYLNGMPLDSTARCIARYQGGIRKYTLSDPSWNDGSLEMTAMASFFEEGAIWYFKAEGFPTPPQIVLRKRRIADTKMQRGGDLGIDARAKFEASLDDEGERLEWNIEGDSFLFYHHQRSGDQPAISGQSDSGGQPAISGQSDSGDQFTIGNQSSLREQFALEEQEQQKLAGRLVIDTPDPFINTVGANLSAAVEGIWDDDTHTWLHGAIGWRTPLAGWRGAYAGDVLGWSGRSREHFEAYLKSMVTEVPQIYDHPCQDSLNTLCRAEKKWGTPMYSNGYICRKPLKPDVMTHYDMNLNLIDELLTHLGYGADTTYLRHIWPYLKLHHEWEKRNFDPDGDHLYDAYCCIWASDALYYNSGAVTHSSAYNYRSNLLTARIAELIGENPEPYRSEAEAILAAMNERLWLEEKGHWAEYQDFMGLKRLHESAAVWSIYTPIDCGACTASQALRATEYLDNCIPHIPVRYIYDNEAVSGLGLQLPRESRDLCTISTTNWLPYVWSTNNVAHEEVANTALAYFSAGRREEGFRLLKADLLDEMYLGKCPGNLGQISWYDKARTEAYRDFADNVGITSRAIVCGLFGIIPEALDGRCTICPGLPSSWKEAQIKTPYISYYYHRKGGKDIYEVEQNFSTPLQIVLMVPGKGREMIEISGSTETKQTFEVKRRLIPDRKQLHKNHRNRNFSKKELAELGLADIKPETEKQEVDISAAFNSNVDDIFRNLYLSPRSPYTTLSLPVQGVGEWCIPHENHEIEDDSLRALCNDGIFDTGMGLKFICPEEGFNIAYTSLWNNYPDSITIPLSGKAAAAYLFMAGSTNNMQSRIDNGLVIIHYCDGGDSVLHLINPLNWCPIEQDYYTDDYAFSSAPVHPYRVLFCNGQVTREPSVDFKAAAENDLQLFDAVKTTDRIIPYGAAQILKMSLDKARELESLELRTLSNDVVIGIMGITLEK